MLMKPKLLLDLYESLVKNCFDRIETRKETIYDRGGESVQTGIDRETYNKSDAGMTLIQSYWKLNWKNVLDEIKKTKRLSAVSSAKVRFSLTWKDFQEPCP